MKYERFEDLPVWKAGVDLAEWVFDLCEDRTLSGKGDLRSQLQRATLSISNNVAEGFERGTTNELLTFLYIARGSAGEVRSMLCLMERLKAFEHLKPRIAWIKGKVEEISRQLRAWAAHLQESDIRGQRYLTQGQRDKDERKKRAEVFYAELQNVVDRKVQQMQHGALARQANQHASPDVASGQDENQVNDARYDRPPARSERGKA